jgi:hypothetical protein
MKIKAIMSFILVIFAQNAHSAQPIPQKETLLYCTGKSSYSSERAAEAIVRITEKDTYIEIDSVGAGILHKQPAMASSIQAIGKIDFNLAQSDHSTIEVSYKLNRYSGEISLTTSSSESNKVLFIGICKPAEPLF